MIAIKSFFRQIGNTVYPRGEVIALHAVAVEPMLSANVVASTLSQDITDVEARFDVEGPICWRDPIARRPTKEERRRGVAERHVARRHK